MTAERSMGSKAYFNATEDVWYVPIATVRSGDDLMLVAPDELIAGVEPVRIQLKDDQLWITRLPRITGLPRPDEQATP